MYGAIACEGEVCNDDVFNGLIRGIVEFPLAVNFMFINEGQHDPVTDDGTLKKNVILFS